MSRRHIFLVGTLVPDIAMYNFSICSSLINVSYHVSYREWCIAIRIESWLCVSLHPYSVVRKGGLCAILNHTEHVYREILSDQCCNDALSILTRHLPRIQHSVKVHCDRSDVSTLVLPCLSPVGGCCLSQLWYLQPDSTSTPYPTLLYLTQRLSHPGPYLI
jgi:hypothetical protein